MWNRTVRKSQQLWDSNAIEKVDHYTVRLHLRVPHLAVPEDLFHYPFAMLDPEENGVFGVGANGTGPSKWLSMKELCIAAFKANKGYWGTGLLEGHERSRILAMIQPQKWRPSYRVRLWGWSRSIHGDATDPFKGRSPSAL